MAWLNLLCQPRRALLRGLLLVILAVIYAGTNLSVRWGLDKRDAAYEQQPQASFRITFGLKDQQPQAWDGHLVPLPSQVLHVEADAFRVHDYRATGFSKSGIVVKNLGEALFPNDFLPNDRSWVCSTRPASMHGPTTEWHVNREIPPTVIQNPSLLLHVRRNPGDLPVRVSTRQGAFSFDPGEVRPFQSQWFLEGNVRLEMLPRVVRAAPQRLGQQDFPSLLRSRSGGLWLAWQEYDDGSDAVLVRKKAERQWGKVIRLTGNADVFRTALGQDRLGNIWVVWAMQRDGNWDLYARIHSQGTWSPLERLTHHRSPDIYHRVVTDSEGRLCLVWQRTMDGRSQIMFKQWNGHQWSEARQLSEGFASAGNNWWPVAAAGPAGSLAVAWDGYASGSYDIFLRRRQGNLWGPVERIAGTARFEAHPTVAIDSQQRIWLAWNESGPEWGKDTGFLVTRKGTQLHESRSIRLVCLDGDRLLTTRGPLATVLDPAQFWELPHLQIDSRDRPWLFVRHLVMRQPDTPLEGPIDLALWEIQATCYRGSEWTPLVALPRSSGRNDMMPATALDGTGGVWAAWSTDKRSTKSYLPHQLRLQLGSFENPSESVASQMTSCEIPQMAGRALQPAEKQEVERVRSYRIRKGPKTYSIYRGDLHRHTDISLDGNNDGSLLDAYRYARDAAALDFVGVADHTDAVEEFYSWWRSHKVADMFQIKDAFVSFYGYERSVEYPNGHRNVFFIRRGEKITPISNGERQGWEGAERLFWHLRRRNGFSIPHTTGRTSGTDWRDHDPQVENLVELFQGMRDTYEYPGSPRPRRLWTRFPDPDQPVPRASSSEASPSFRRPGFVWQALEKGHKLGFIASSDHISCHISYACLLAEKLDPESLLEAVRARRAYAATDNLILDIKALSSDGEHLIGEIFASKSPIRIKARVIGTDTIRQIDVIKDGQFVKTLEPDRDQVEFEFQDSATTPGESYYYVRVIQRNGEMAWASPFWVNYD